MAAALLFAVVAGRIFWGEQLLPTATPLPFFAYPFLVLTFVGWIVTLLEGKTRMNDDVDLSIRQFSQAWQLMTAGSHGYTREAVEGIEYIFSGLPIGFFNVALLTGRDVSGDAVTSHGTAACAWASGRNVPWLFVVTHEALAPGVDAAARLDGCGLAPMMPLTGMLAGRISPASRASTDLELIVPHDDDGCSALLDVNSAAYGMELTRGRP